MAELTQRDLMGVVCILVKQLGGAFAVSTARADGHTELQVTIHHACGRIMFAAPNKSTAEHRYGEYLPLIVGLN